MTRILVTGAGGMLGRDIVAAAGDVEIVALTHGDLDITDPSATAAAVAGADPDVVINCAAWTDVDGAERDEAAALAINATGPGNLAAAVVERELEQLLGQVHGVGGAAELVRERRDILARLRAREDERHEVRATSAKQPGRADDRVCG